MADFIIVSKPSHIALECPFCESDIEISWAKINHPKCWTDDWEDVKCPDCGKMISLGEWEYECYSNVDAVNNAPAVDAVAEVVRCRECTRFSPCKEIEGVSWTGWCNYGEFHTDEEDFCSRGERKET